MAILKKGNILGVCVHHSVYKPAKNLAELKTQAKLFNGWHSKKSWAEATKTPSAYPYISYHYLMATNGDLLKVTDEKYVKYHAGDNSRGDLSFNLHGIAVCLTGNYQNDKPTSAQMESLVKFIRDVEKRYDINARVRGHKETSTNPTACPGTNIGTSKSGWLKQVIANVNNKDYPPKPEPDPCEKYKKQISELESKVVEYEKEIKRLLGVVEDLKIEMETIQEGAEQRLVEWEDKYAELKSELTRVQREKGECQEELSAVKGNRFLWLAQWLDKVVPKKE